MFKFWKPKSYEPQCTCGAWPDPSWKQEDYLKKFEAVQNCPVHHKMQMVMAVQKLPMEIFPQLKERLNSQTNPAPTVPVQPAPNGAVESPFHHIAASENEVHIEPGALGQELRNARIHLLNCTNLVPARAELWGHLNEIIEALEEIIEEEK